MLALLLPSLGFSGPRTILEPDVRPHDPATSSWRKVSFAPADLALSLSVPLALKPEARTALEATLYAVSPRLPPTCSCRAGWRRLAARGMPSLPLIPG